MTEYPKINTLWKRDEKTHRIIEGEYSEPEFAVITRWRATEKVDGTNIRIYWDYLAGRVSFQGRTDDAQIPPPLLAYLASNFTPEKMAVQFGTATHVVLYGEGYGPKVQNGGRYRASPGFILFDVLVDGTWLEFDNVKDVATKLGIPHVPDLGVCTMGKIVERVQDGFASTCADDTTLLAEGVVATSSPMMLTRWGHRPVRWKLKARDFVDRGR
jgi:hypothetical protein